MCVEAKLSSVGILSHAQRAVWFVCDQGTRTTGKVLKLVLGGLGRRKSVGRQMKQRAPFLT